MSELSPGSTGRRWTPEGGERKHREKIHRESKIADDHKNLPFSFSKPPKSGPNRTFKCLGCGALTSAPKNTVMIVCRECKNACKVELIDE